MRPPLAPTSYDCGLRKIGDCCFNCLLAGYNVLLSYSARSKKKACNLTDQGQGWLLLRKWASICARAGVYMYGQLRMDSLLQIRHQLSASRRACCLTGRQEYDYMVQTRRLTISNRSNPWFN